MIDKWRNIKERLKGRGKISLRFRAVQCFGVFLGMMLLFTTISRAADSVTVARVTVEAAQRKIIEHLVSSEGKVLQNREQAVLTEPNLTIDSIFGREGQALEAGDLLMQLNQKDIEEQILVLKQEIEKLKLVNKDLNSKKAADKDKKSTAAGRAGEDYDRAASQGEERVASAAEALSAARERLESFYQRKQDNSGDSSVEDSLEENWKAKKEAWNQKEEDVKKGEKEVEQSVQKAIQKAREESAAGTLTQQQEADIRRQVEEENADRLSKLRQQAEEARREADAAQSALEAYRQQKDAQQGQNASDTEEQLKQEIAAKEQAYEEAVAAKEEAQTAARRSLEDAEAAEGSDSTVQINELDMEKKQMDLEKLELLKEAEGKLYSPVSGVITKVAVMTGDKTPETASMTIADLSSGCKFTTQIDKTQAKYVNQGDAVSLTSVNHQKTIEDLKVDSITTNSEEKEKLDVTILLSSQTLEIGSTATMKLVKKSKPYSTCIPVQALRSENNKYYVLVMQEKESVLGKELTAEKVDVTVKDKNETYAALEEGALTPELQIITESDRNIEAGSRVRLAES